MSKGLNQLNIHDVKSVKQTYREYPTNSFITSKIKITDQAGNVTNIVLFGDSREDLKIQT